MPFYRSAADSLDRRARCRANCRRESSLWMGSVSGGFRLHQGRIPAGMLRWRSLSKNALKKTVKPRLCGLALPLIAQDAPRWICWENRTMLSPRQKPRKRGLPGHTKYDFTYSIETLKPDAIERADHYRGFTGPHFERAWKRDYVFGIVDLTGRSVELWLRKDSPNIDWTVCKLTPQPSHP